MEVTKCINPSTGEVLATYPVDSIDDLKEKIKKSREAQKEWKKLSVKARAKRLASIQNYIGEHAEEIAETISADNGKLKIEAMATEVLPAGLGTSYYTKKAKKYLKGEKLKHSSVAFLNKSSKVVYEPLGVIGVISPWNYPFSIAFSEILMGLIAGNGVILKTATETVYTGLKLKEVFDSADIPEDLFQFVNIPGRIAGDAFIDCGVDKLFFTGSVRVGKILMKKASERLLPLSLELGGNDAMLVCGDADLDRAAAGAVWAGLQNSGQSCGGVERIYVHESAYDEFLEHLKKNVEAMRPGHSGSFDCDMGIMTTKKQIGVVDEHIKDAKEKGATVFAVGASSDNDQYICPMVLTDVNHDMKLMKYETFGPVLGVMKVSSMEEALALANDSHLGLTGSVWSKDKKKAEYIASQIEAGVITVNDHLMTHGMAETSWGGMKESGLGRTHGKLGFLEMVQPKFIVKDSLSGLKSLPWWPPYSEDVYRGLKSMVEFFNCNFSGKKIKGMFGTLRLLKRKK